MAKEDKDIIEEIQDIVQDEIQKSLQPIEFPTEMEVTVTNQPEPPQMPKIDFSGLESRLDALINRKREEFPKTDLKPVEVLLERILELEQPDNSELLNQILKAVGENKPTPVEIDFSSISDEMKGMVDAVRNIRVTGHGGISSKRNLQNAKGVTINPSVAVSDEEVLSTSDPQGIVIAGKVSKKGTDDKAEYIEIVNKGLGVFNLSDRDLVERQTVLLELISLKLDCLQRDQITEDDIEN